MKWPYQNFYDTESFAYNDGIQKHISIFDTSVYPQNDIFGVPRVNKNVLGLFKDEANSKIITIFIML